MEAQQLSGENNIPIEIARFIVSLSNEPDIGNQYEKLETQHMLLGIWKKNNDQEN